MRGRWDPVNDAIRASLTRITLAEMRALPPQPRTPTFHIESPQAPHRASAAAE